MYSGGFGYLQNWRVGSRYRCERPLGVGSYGEVVGSKDLRTGGEVAIKRMERIFCNKSDSACAFREIHILRRLDHPCIIKLTDVFCSAYPAPSKDKRTQEEILRLTPSLTKVKDVGDLYLTFEYAETDLKKFLNKNIPLSIENIKHILHQILSGLNYAHSARVIHRDLKPANILISTNNHGLFTAKIADFGLARVCEDYVFGQAETSVTNANHNKNCGSKSKYSSSLISCLPSPKRSRSGLSHSKDDGTEDCDALFEDKSKCLDNSKETNDLVEESDEILNPKLPESEPIPILKRQLSSHVVTRHYRAPEVILKQQYCRAIDVWSVGCILAELFAVQAGNEPFSSYGCGKTLFPGGSWGELSRDREVNRPGQLAVIIDVLGIGRCGDSAGFGVHAVEQIQQLLASSRRYEGIDFKSRFQSTPSEGIDLLLSLLSFNPTTRITVEDALGHQFLASQRRREIEVCAKEPLDALSVDEYETPEHILSNVLRELNYYNN